MTATMASSDYLFLQETIHELLQTESKYRPNLCQTEEIIASGTRDGTAHMLRFMSFFYEMPAEVFIYAINLVDLLLSKMKVLPSHLPCIMVACFSIATYEVAYERFDIDDLVKMTKAHCTKNDVKNLMDIIRKKVLMPDYSKMVTTCDWMRELLYGLLKDEVREQLPMDKMHTHLVMISCNSKLVSYRPYEIAGNVIIYNMKKTGIAIDEIENFEIDTLILCYGNLEHFALVGANLEAALDQYEGNCKKDTREIICWRSTVQRRKRSCDLIDRMPTIFENSPKPKSPRLSDNDEGTKGWPRSPVCPVYRQE